MRTQSPNEPPEATSDKRDAPDSPGQIARAKRARYVTTACNECKRRKVKCDGDCPCRRCVGAMITCSYARVPRDTEAQAPRARSITESRSVILPESTKDELQRLNRDLQRVMAEVSILQQRLGSSIPTPAAGENHVVRGKDYNSDNMMVSTENGRLPHGMTRASEDAEPETVSPQYHGPTSTEFSLRLANESLTGFGADCEVGLDHQTDSTVLRSRNTGILDSRSLLRKVMAQDPLWKIPQVDVLRYIDVYRDSLGAMYPIIDCEAFKTKARILCEEIRQAHAREVEKGFGVLLEHTLSADTQLIKIIVAIGLENDMNLENSDEASQLMESVSESNIDTAMHAQGLRGIHLLILSALFYMTLDNEVKASRYICVAARAALEMGLHRRDMITEHFPDTLSRTMALRTFWSVFTLDRRSSIGLGVPFVIQDYLIDPALTQMDFDHAYLRIMIPFTKLSGRAWQMGNDFSNKDLNTVGEEIDYLDYQVLQWRKTIPDHLRYNSQSIVTDRWASEQQFYLAVALHVRGNQLRNVICRPLLMSSTQVRMNPSRTINAVNIAKESLHVLLELDGATDLLWTHATFFKHFIVSALGNLLLVALHSPEEYWMTMKEAFQLGLALVRKLSKRSRPVMRMWRRLKGLENLQSKFAAIQQRAANATIEVCPDPISPYDASDFMFFDSDIRDEFAGVFDPSSDLGDFFNLPMPNGEGA